MKFKILMYSLILYVTLIIQSTFAGSIQLFGVKPNLLLVVIVCIAMIRGGSEAAIFGIVAGFLMDGLTGKYLGPYAFLCFITAVLLSGFNKKFYKENILIVVLSTFVVTIIYESFFFINTIFNSGVYQFFYVLKFSIVKEALYNFVFAFPVFLIILKMSRMFEKRDRASHKA